MMKDRIEKADLAKLLARRMKSDEQTASAWLDAMIESLYQCFKKGQKVTLPGLGGFYVRPGGSTCAFKFNPAQRLRALFGWSSSYKRKL